jgi:pantoate--beta-alanine ligase
VTVVHRLLDIVRPHRLYMGQKDFQQFTIIQHMITTLALPVGLVVCPISREPHGLAMSSRNVRLSADVRAAASKIYSTLQWVKSQVPLIDPLPLCNLAIEKIDDNTFTTEYLTIVDGHTLKPIHQWRDTDYAVVCTVVRADGVRLLDNEILKQNKR